MINLIIIRGLPGTGKSTMAKEQYPDYLHYEPDQLFCSTQGYYRYDKQLWKDACNFVYRLADFALARGESVVISDVFAKEKEVFRYKLLAKYHGANFGIITLKTIRKNTHKVPFSVVAEMREAFEEIDNK